MVSLKDISLRCGVSVATVSKALNGHKDISEATRKRLADVAKEMGYYPNSQARALKTNRTYNIGVIIFDNAGKGLTHEFFIGILNGIIKSTEYSGYDVTLISKDSVNRRMSTYEHCKYRNVDGIIILCTDFKSSDVYEVINGDIPVITIDHIFDCRSAVVSNNERAMEEMLTYVYKCGHRKIAFIRGTDSSVTEKRMAGFCKSCINLGIEIKDEWMLSGVYLNTECTYKLTKKLLQSGDCPTCIFMPDDYSALGGIKAIRESGLSVPDDISVVGYDGIICSQFLSPKLTTYLQNSEKMGIEAANKLILLIENPQITFNEVINVDGELLKGESVKHIM